ncbi:hypothetical protein J1G44_09625 [Cellulomonas sp. zg-ZUI199]|uniref:DUF4340 domain-containing protein n=1 Tax=Cellulomonas wangleii TaxID=2816956 RepID=A0ABX8D641_9CELL|nr:hypothetical protein [Cellulomonas wangleii]MBO0924741.1 hypothetical protein [Cellulomonas wangleii]QVI62923.1 hypothetical protein KG103_03030 [Cellulomonas wangleii]
MSDTGRPGQPQWVPGATGPTHRPAVTPQGVPGPVVGDDGPGDGAPGGRPRWMLPAIIGVAVLVVAGLVAGAVAVFGDRGADEPAPAETVVLPLPTPAVAPVARPATTAFASALPASVLQYALESSQDDAEWLGAGALEAYTETFTDGDGGTLTVRAAQLETAQDATTFLQGLTATLPGAAADTATSTEPAQADAPDLPQTGEVTVGGEPVGTFTVVDAGDGTGVAVWQNATAVFRLTAPLADVLDAYAAYGL